MLGPDLKGKPWPIDKSNAVIQRLKQDAREELYARDKERTIAVLKLNNPDWTDAEVQRELDMLGWDDDAKRVGCAYRLFVPDASGNLVRIPMPKRGEVVPPNAERVVDASLGRVLHSGEDVTKLYRAKYAKFCSKPRDHSKVSHVPAYTEDDPLGQNKQARGVAAFVPWGDESESEVEAPVKRRGRPRKELATA